MQLFTVFYSESFAVVGTKMQWDHKKQDYIVTKAWGPGDSVVDEAFEGTTCASG